MKTKIPASVEPVIYPARAIGQHFIHAFRNSTYAKILFSTSMLFAAGLFFQLICVPEILGNGPGYEVIPPTEPVQPNAITVPNWSNSFIYAGTAYPYTMVGTDPTLGPATTTVAIQIIPLRFVFADGQVLDGNTKSALTAGSPIFQNANFTSGMTQYGDAIQRAQFWSTGGSNPGYHVLLGQPTIMSTVTINVPAHQGRIVIGPSNVPFLASGARVGLIEASWFYGREQNLIASMRTDPRVITILLTYNTFLYHGDTSNCCILGWHGALNAPNGNGNQKVNLYIFASYSDPGTFTNSDYIQDIASLSHEVCETLSDPFISNVVPAWYVPTSFYGCNALLETGDPVTNWLGFTVQLNGTTYHPEDQFYFSWFARESPSRAQNGNYTYLNAVPTYSSDCP